MGHQHSHVAFEFPSTRQTCQNCLDIVVPGSARGEVDKQPAVVSGPFACAPERAKREACLLSDILQANMDFFLIIKGASWGGLPIVCLL